MRILLPDGDPDGLKVVRKSNWTGSGLVIPRPLLSQAEQQREELGRAGVYILIGPTEASTLRQAYVSEGAPVLRRLRAHDKDQEKDFWTHAVVFTTEDHSLNKAHVLHLEARLIALAHTAKRCVLANVKRPEPPSLTEADTVDIEGFLDDILLCLPVLGVDLFAVAPEPVSGAVEYKLAAVGIEANGFESGQGFVVKAGSGAVRAGGEVRSAEAFLVNLRAELFAQAVLADAEEGATLTQDYTFASSSTAAAVLLGRNANGRTAWKTGDGRTLKSVQEAAAADD